MDVAVFALILFALAAFVAAPLYARGRSAPARTRATSDAGQEAAERALGDLEVDRASGLLDEAEYRAERAALEARATHRPTSD